MPGNRQTSHSFRQGWLAALLLAASSLAVAADIPPVLPLPGKEVSRSCLGETVAAEPLPEVPLQARVVAHDVLEQVYALPDEEKRYFLEKRRNAAGFAIFPNVQRSGFMVATLYGKGLLSYRDNGSWSPPVLLTMQGQSLGPQLSAQSNNVIFIFKTIDSIRDFLSGHHHVATFVRDTAVEHVEHAADPLGITVHVFDRGSMFGQSSDAFTIHVDEEANAALYGVAIKPGCIVEGTRSGPRAPWLLHYFETMKLPAGQAPHVIELK